MEGLGRAEVEAAFDVQNRDTRRALALGAFANLARLGEVVFHDRWGRRLLQVEGDGHRGAEKDRDVERGEERRGEGREEDDAVLGSGFQDEFDRGEVRELEFGEDDQDCQGRERYDGHRRAGEEEGAEDEAAAEERGHRRPGAAGDVEG